MRILPILVIGLLSGCATSERVEAILRTPGDVGAGESLYPTHCAGCHGQAGAGGDGGPAIDHGHGDRTTASTILDGSGTMPAFETILGDQDVADLIAFLNEEIFVSGH